MNTKLLYMENMQLLECNAYVEKVDHKDGKTIIYLDQTVFYPQGGGQPYDTGTITTPDASLTVEEVRYDAGKVQHIGILDGQIMQGEDVECKVDAERRILNTRLHSGGHIVDMAVYELGYDWEPKKGYHFPQGAYVEYAGSLAEDKETLVAKLNEKINDILARNIHTEIRFMPKEEMSQYCRHVPDFLPAGKPSRIVLYGSFGVPWGGTHVAELNDIGKEYIRKVKAGGSTIRISYEVE